MNKKECYKECVPDSTSDNFRSAQPDTLIYASRVLVLGVPESGEFGVLVPRNLSAVVSSREVQ